MKPDPTGSLPHCQVPRCQDRGGRGMGRLPEYGWAVTHGDIEPLETGTWLRELEKLATDRQRSETTLVRAFRRALYLTQLAPRPLRHLVRCSVTELEFERLLEADELFKAAQALVGDRLGYSLTRVDDGERIEAEVWFPAGNPSASTSARDEASALLQAWLRCLAALDGDADFSLLSASPPVRRKSQFARHPRLTEH